MKTITILTDFSERSANAARYALHLASYLQANILLYHTFLVAGDAEIKANTEQDLRLQAGLLTNELTKLPDGAFRPAIGYRCHEGTVNGGLNSLLTDKDQVLLVMADHHPGFSALMTGDHLRGVLDGGVQRPVLIIPDHHSFKPIRKIAFPTDLDAADLDVVNSLIGLARPFQAELMLAHIGAESNATAAPVRDFLQEIGNRIDYPHIYYRAVEQKKMGTGLQKLEQNVGADLLVMVHRNKGLAERIFGGSHTQKIAARPLLPLLVYPYPAASLPVL